MVRKTQYRKAVHYIHYRVILAGAKEDLFSGGAAETIAEASGGVPRVIKGLCDAALVYGFAQQAKKITRQPCCSLRHRGVSAKQSC